MAQVTGSLQLTDDAIHLVFADLATIAKLLDPDLPVVWAREEVTEQAYRVIGEALVLDHLIGDCGVVPAMLAADNHRGKACG